MILEIERKEQGIQFIGVRKILKIISSIIPYLYYYPVYQIFIQIYAFCRIDDLSWGTKSNTEYSFRGWNCKLGA